MKKNRRQEKDKTLVTLALLLRHGDKDVRAHLQGQFKILSEYLYLKRRLKNRKGPR